MTTDSSSIRDLLSAAAKVLQDAAIEEPRLEAELLLCEVLKWQLYQLHLHPEQLIDPAIATSFHDLVMKRASHQPFAYITGRREFYSLEFKVLPGVLIPRPETELIIEEALKLPTAKDWQLAVDVGTGSGALACTLAHELPQLKVLALDISQIALNTARENATQLGLDKRVSVMESSWLTAAPGNLDLVVSNPPYIPSADIPGLMPEVRQEPLLALDGGPDGLGPYRELVPMAFEKLKEGGYLLVEHGYDQAVSIQHIFQTSGFAHIKTYRDLAGIERVTAGQKLEH